jgi:hypothetical protein
MNDDYLWNGSGEPDPEVQRLERVLGKYRYQPRSLGPALTSHFSWQRRPWVRLVAAAAAILMILAGLWIFKLQNQRTASAPALEAKDVPTQQQAEPQKPAPDLTSRPIATAPLPRKPAHKIYHRPSEEKPAENLTVGDSTFIAERQPIIIPFIDLETARHLEQAQLLLRSFRNSRDADVRSAPDLSYERQRSRGLLSKNILLRRDAEAKGNMPAEELLGSLEPFLLDIANLPESPSGDDVRSIKERMQKKEIVSALQIYSSPALSQVF